MTHSSTAAPDATLREADDTSSTLDAIPGGHWLAEDPMRSAFLVLTLLALAIRASVLKDSYFITDDFMLSTRAMESPLSWGYLTRVHTGHFEPIGFATMWMLAHFAPLSWGWACVALIAGQLVLHVMVWKLLVEVFGRRPLIIAPYALFSFTPLTLPSFTWLSAAIIWLPLMISVAGASRWHTRHVRTGRAVDALAATAWFVVGLASFEKAVVYLPFAAALTLAVAPEVRMGVRGVATLVRRTWMVWVGYALASAAYLVLYLHGARGNTSELPFVPPKVGPLSDFTFFSLFRTFIPGAFGGPWSWQPNSYGLALVDSPRAFDWACWILATAVIVGSLVLRRNIGRFWFALLVYIAFSMAAVAIGRVGFGGAILALETRYLADAAVPLVIVLGACLMPLRGERAPWTPLARRFVESTGNRPRYGALVAVVTLVVALSFHAMGGYAKFSTANPTRGFVENTKASLASLPADAEIYDTELPGQIIGPLFAEYNLVTRYLSPMVSDSMRKDLYTKGAYTKPYVINAFGQLTPMRVTAAATATAKPGRCTPVNDGEVRVPLTVALFEWGWAARIGYLSEAETTGVVRLGAAQREIEIHQGLGEVYVSLAGAGNELRITDIPPGVNFCVGDVQVGSPTPKG